MTNDRINVTKSQLPDRDRFHNYVDRILDSGWFTNRGQFVRELEARLELYLGVKNLVLVNNATLGLQVAYKALALSGEVITSPFTFVATSSSAVWEGLDVTFADIDPLTFNIDVSEIEKKINPRTSAILPVHVFGNPCDVAAIDELAQKHSLKVIYDAAHAFSVRYGGRSILNRGDVSILSFHATKLFHTIEGGALIVRDDEVCSRIRKMINFGITGPESIECLGINAKMNEFQAAMGLCLLDDMDHAIVTRGELTALYDEILGDKISRQSWFDGATRNYGYYPVLFESEQVTKQVQSALNNENIYPRRYFYPSLNSLQFIGGDQPVPNSEDIASRILCLPLYADMTVEQCARVAELCLATLVK